MPSNSTRCVIFTLFFVMWSGVDAQSLNVDEVIARHIQARGGHANIKAITNLVYRHGTYQEGNYSSDGNATMSMARPWFKLVGDKNKPGGFMEGYDGSAWEWFADPGIVVRTVGPASAAIRHYAGVEGPLVDYRQKGSTALLKGQTELKGSVVWVVEMTRRDGFTEQFYFDGQSFLIVASGASAPIHAFGKEVTQLTTISDYRKVAGVNIPFRFSTIELPSGRTLSSMQWGKVEANVDLPKDWFSPPSFKRSNLQALIEHLYEQRSDLKAMMWTYQEFRLAFPDLDVSEALNIAAYQILKMGELDQAIALLQENIKDFPQSADARFGLGRAYLRAGLSEKAQEQFKSALKIDPDHARATGALDRETGAS